MVVASTYVTYVFLSFLVSFAAMLMCVCVFFFSSLLLTCLYRCVCLCAIVSFFPLFVAVAGCCFFFRGPFKRCPSSALFLLLCFALTCNSRGSLSPLLFFSFNRTKHTRARAHVQTLTDTVRSHREKSARAPLVFGGAHTKLFCVLLLLLLLCVIAIIMIGCCCYSLFMG